MDAPVDGLLSLVEEAALDEGAKRTCDIRLVARAHRHVRLVPLTEHEETFELPGHDADEVVRRGATRAAHVGDRHVALLRPELAIDLQLDWQTVAVVAG